ncbi:MAG: hypothetical protein JO208_07105 [Alphaproteobacteria bacterium]|nr:hypothetical protein [Alphaproteobacteria bacterium]
MKGTAALCSVCLLTAIGFAGSAQGTSPIAFKSWEVASEFSDTANPAGAWQYGYEPTLNDVFSLLPVAEHQFPAIYGWQRTGDINEGPFINHNKKNVQKGPFGSKAIVYPPHSLSLHPGQLCEYADLRFTAPAAGNYRITGQFYAMDYGGQTTTDVHVSVNQVEVFAGTVSYSSSPTASFTPSQLLVPLQANDVIDFQVGCGSNNNYFSDTTGLNAVIEVE